MTSATTTTTFEDWTAGRHVPNYGTNDGASPIAFQNWHHFKEAFPPELIARAVQSSDRPVVRCIDPFGGSGTTALACQMLGINSDTIEVNPFLADAIRAKLASYDLDSLIDDFMTVRRLSRSKTAATAEDIFRHVPPTFIQRPNSERWIFHNTVANRLAAILDATTAIESETNRRLMRVIVGGFLTEVSNVVVSGKGRRYRRNWQHLTPNPDRVEMLFAQRTEQAISEIQQFSRRPVVTANLHRGDARTTQIDGPFDLSVFSPPYPNSFDYTDVYNLELWMVGYLREASENRALRNATLTSHVQLVREYAAAPPGSTSLEKCLVALEQSLDSLWSPWIPKMIGGYFADLTGVVDRVWSLLQPTAQTWIVVGDSQYANTHIPVATILLELADTHGWIVAHHEPIRHMKSSPQQGWKAKLVETLLVLKKPS